MALGWGSSGQSNIENEPIIDTHQCVAAGQLRTPRSTVGLPLQGHDSVPSATNSPFSCQPVAFHGGKISAKSTIPVRERRASRRGDVFLASSRVAYVPSVPRVSPGCPRPPALSNTMKTPALVGDRPCSECRHEQRSPIFKRAKVSGRCGIIEESGTRCFFVFCFLLRVGDFGSCTMDVLCPPAETVARVIGPCLPSAGDR